MPGIVNVQEHGPLTYMTSAAVLGGQLVEPHADGIGVKPAVAGSKKVLGAAVMDATPAVTATPSYNIVVNPVRPEVAVAYRGVYRLTYAANAALGDLLVAAADGKVTPYNSATNTYDQIVGRCVEPGGVLINKRGKVLLQCAG